jgi:hypothetical protein
MANTADTAPKFKRRLLGYRRGDVDDRLASLQAEHAKHTADLEFEVGRLAEELSATTDADGDLALRATRRAVETILTDAKNRAEAMIGQSSVVDLRASAPAAGADESVVA